MEKQSVRVRGRTLPVYTAGVAVVGSGAAGYASALRLAELGVPDVLLVTEKREAGTSRNTGSDKQTYYKLTAAGAGRDSVEEMAGTLFAGGCMDGEHALIEAACSGRCFHRLVELGVPFPHNRWGEFVGYKTDHDPRQRATSAGPYTSRFMTRRLEEAVERLGVPLLDGCQVVRILRDGSRAAGLLCHTGDPGRPFAAVRCGSVVYATGGPAGIYRDTVYPACHHGATGIALEAGAAGRNLTEWQFGLASLAPRWNVSGTYMQALPRFVSTSRDGGDPREFLAEALPDPGEMLTLTFLKGYQWPFDARKLPGSSLIDLLVHRETVGRGRRVFLDFTRNPGTGALPFQLLGEEARDYLERAEACFGTPVERLAHMNRPAVDFYREHGVDLAVQPLEIALCAQHCNGGLAVDSWWETALPGLYAVGEAAGTHGVYRPGGSALNAGQVGALRAAQHIACSPEKQEPVGETAFAALLEESLPGLLVLEGCLGRGASNLEALREEARGRMSAAAGAIRDPALVRDCLDRASRLLEQLPGTLRLETPGQLGDAFRLRDMLLCQTAVLQAMDDYAGQGGGSRGSALCRDPAGSLPHPALPEDYRMRPDTGMLHHRVQELTRVPGGWRCRWRRVRRIPERDQPFETVWRAYRRQASPQGL